MIWSRKLTPSALRWLSRSWQTCKWCSLSSYVSIHESHLAQTLWHPNIVTIISNTLKSIFSSIHNSLVITHQLEQTSWLRHYSFCGVTAVHSCLEYSLSFMSLPPLLKCSTHHITVLTSSAWPPETFRNRQWMSVSAILFYMEEFHYLCFIWASTSDTIFQTALCCHLSHGNKT